MNYCEQGNELLEVMTMVILDIEDSVFHVRAGCPSKVLLLQTYDHTLGTERSLCNKTRPLQRLRVGRVAGYIKLLNK